MKINFKLLVFIITAALSITIIGNSLFGHSIKNYLREQEKNQIVTNVQNVSSNLGAMMAKYEAVAEDWGYWDETYAFIVNNAPDYIELNLSPDSLSNINVNIMAFYNKAHENVYKVNYDLENAVFIPFPETLSIKIDGILKENKATATSIIKNVDEYYMISIVETTDSLREQPPNGHLVVGRQIDAAEIGNLEHLTNSKINFISKDAAANSGSDGSYISLDTGDALYSTLINEKTEELTTYIIPKNLDDSSPSVAVEMTSGREIFSQGLGRLNFIQVVYTVWIIIIVLLLFWLLRVNITNPVRRLSNVLNNIDTGKSKFDKLPVNEKNELSIINSAINNMFSRIENQQEYLKESENRLLSAQQMAHVGNWDLDLHTMMLWASVEAFNIYGIESGSQVIPAEIEEERILPEYREAHRATILDLINENKEYDEIYKISQKSTGEERFIRSKAVRVVDENGKVIKVTGAIQDITDYKKSEQEILYISNHDQLTGLYNRRFYEKELVNLDTEANLPLTIAMGDINGLKLINDSFGHTMGDELIMKAACVIAEGCRANDILARLGGMRSSL